MAADEFPDGVWLCELAPVADPTAVAHAVATTLSVRRRRACRCWTAWSTPCGAGACCLILDNCEHVLDAAAELVGRVTAVVSDGGGAGHQPRAGGRGGERVWAVPSLDAGVEGVELFCDRAAAADAAFSPSEADRAVVARDLRAARRDTPRHRAGRRPGPFHDPRPRWPAGSMTASGCCGAAAAGRGTPSDAAGDGAVVLQLLSGQRSGCCSTGWRCSPAGSTSPPPRRSAPTTRSTGSTSATCWPPSSTSRWSSPTVRSPHPLPVVGDAAPVRRGTPG